MQVFRITKKKYAQDLSGEGAKLFGGRWNDIGFPVIYTSSSISLAFLELLVHSDRQQLQQSFVVMQIGITQKAIPTVVLREDMDEVWRHSSDFTYTQKIGSDWLGAKESLICKVPSVLIPYEQNVLINPKHPNIKKVKIEKVFDLDIDKRFLR